MGGPSPRHLTLDAGALVLFDDRSRPSARRVYALVERAVTAGRTVVIPSGALAQAWRDGRTQARLARLLTSRNVRVDELTTVRAKAAGELCAARRSSDIVDASVVIAARLNGGVVVTSDADDLRRLDPTLDLIAI